MAIFDLVCDTCGKELADVLLPPASIQKLCPQCGSQMRRKPSTFSVRGLFHWMGDRGKEDKIVSYPTHTRRKSHNELYSSGGL